MNAQTLQMIRRYHGYVYEVVGLVSAFFSNTQDAHACADELRACVGEVLICGTQLTFSA